MSQSDENRVVLAKKVAETWLRSRLKPEHRLKVLYNPRHVRNLPNLLRAFRDGKVRLASVPPISDLGISTGFDSITVWSSDREAMLKLDKWFERKNLETSGIW